MMDASQPTATCDQPLSPLGQAIYRMLEEMHRKTGKPWKEILNDARKLCDWVDAQRPAT